MRYSFLIGLALCASNSSWADTAKDKEIEPVSKAEFIAAQSTLFRKADTDFNGLISFRELNVAQFESLKIDSRVQFKRLDTNSNNFLSEDEITAGQLNERTHFEEAMQGSKAILLKTYDRNRNGTITSDEIDIALERRAEKLKREAEKEGQKTFKKIDKDKNGYISTDEYEHHSTYFLKAVLGNTPVGEYLTRDTNGDRAVHRDEHKEFVETLFQILDKNKDEELSAAEQTTEVYTTFQTFDLTGVFSKMEQLINDSKNQDSAP